MAVTEQTPVTTHTANGATNVFPFSFKVLSSADLRVLANGVAQDLDVDYTVTGVGVESGGSITMSAAPAAGVEVLIYRKTQIARTDDYQTAGDLPASTVNLDYDRLWMAMQELLAGLFGTLPQPGSALALLGRLQNGASASDGAGIVAYNSALSYPLGTVGYELNHNSGNDLPIKLLKADFGAVGDGLADDTAVLRSAIAALPEGTMLGLDGYFRITDTVVWNRRISPLCFGADCGIVVDVGTTKDGLVFIGTDATLQWGLNDLNTELNVYGKNTCCRYAVVATRVDRSRMRLNIRAGAVAQALRVRGCLINRWDIQSTVNFKPPTSLPFTAGTQTDHMLVENYGVPTGAFQAVTVTGPASPAVVTLNAHGFLADQPVVFAETGTAPPAPFIVGKPYFVRSPATNTFQLSETRGGTAINSTGTGSSPQLAVCSAIASNTNTFFVNLEGARDGYLQTAMPGEGTNWLTGEIEGLTGVPVYVEDNIGFGLHNLKMEANSAQSTIKNALIPVIGDGVQILGDLTHSRVISIQNCRGYKFGAGVGNINIDAASRGGEIGAWLINDIDGMVCLDPSCVQRAGIVNSATATVMAGGPGAPTMENVFINPYFDLWAGAGSSNPPLGTTIASGLANRVTSPRYPGNPNIYSCRVTTGAAGIGNGLVCTPGFSPPSEDGWISIFCAVQVPTGMPGVRIFIFDGTQYNFIGGNTTTKDTWLEYRGSARMIAGQQISVVIVGWDGSTYPNGAQFYVGGLSMCFGAVPPTHLADHGRRRANIIQTIANTPDFQGQIAISGAALFMGVSTGSPSDWLKISP